ncbi:DUF4153 domain-containing protein [Streptomyces sp. NPDC002564]|uniref:DUF4153 domain-containing protein n=1 Tax=Streptomyces sp. NPDC002564 TaxID=3364649 RepID=UPI0036BA9DAB
MGPGPKPDAEPGPKPGPGPGAKPDSEAGSKLGSGPESELGSESGSKPDAEPGSEPDAESESKLGSEPGAKPDSESPSKPDTEPGPKPDAEAKIKPDAEAGASGGWAYSGSGAGAPLLADLRAEPPAPVRAATLWAVLATGVLSMLLLGEGLALNLLIVAVPAALAAHFAAETAGRRPRPWSWAWAAGGLALLAVPALSDAGWTSFLAIVAAVALGSLALHGSRTWIGILLSPLGLYDGIFSGLRWGWRGVRERTSGARGAGPVLRAVGIAAALLLVFGALFAGADAAFADLLGELIPDASLTGSPWRVLLLIAGMVGALAVARAAASPVRWDRLVVKPGRARGRVEWALPLIVLNVLFAAFNAVQLAVLFGGYDTVLDKTGLTYSAYARQGFWQLLLATLLTLVVIVFALRWAPRGGAQDRTLVRAVLGTLCVMTLVVVASAVRRMDMYVEAYGLTRMRISVVAGELWLGVIIVLIMAAGVWGARWLPRAVAASAAAGVLAFGLLTPDALIAERNVRRYEETGKFDLDYTRQLSADAVPALDRLPEPVRSCALREIADDLDGGDAPWFATSLGESRARRIIEDRPLRVDATLCGARRDTSDTSY